MFDNNFGKCGQISIFIHQLMRKKIQDKEFHLQYIITLPCEIQKSKILQSFRLKCDN